MIIVYITCADEKEANVVAEHLINKNLIACANIFPIKSIYKWKGEIAAEKEFVVLAKTRNENYERVKKETKTVHSYEVPCILRVDAKANHEFDEWINSELK